VLYYQTSDQFFLTSKNWQNRVKIIARITTGLSKKYFSDRNIFLYGNALFSIIINKKAFFLPSCKSVAVLRFLMEHQTSYDSD
jgi:hypothetical protein